MGKCNQKYPKLCGLKASPNPDANKLITDLITSDDINHEFLREIFIGEDSERAVTLINEKRCESGWTQDYEHSLIVAFMLAVHKEDIHVCQNLINWDPSLRYLACLAMLGYQGYDYKKNIRKPYLQGEVKGGLKSPKNESANVFSTRKDSMAAGNFQPQGSTMNSRPGSAVPCSPEDGGINVMEGGKK